MKFYATLLLCLFITGCAETTVKDVALPDDRQQVLWDRQNTLYAIPGWLIKGRVAVQAGQEGWTATMHWAQDHDLYNLRIIAPLGQGTYELRGNNKQVILMTAKNELLTASDPEALLLENMGWKVPLSGLRYWIRGVPEPVADVREIVRDPQGRIIDMEQLGWRISFLRYTDGKQPELPEKIFMQNERFQLRLVIQDWKLAS